MHLKRKILPFLATSIDMRVVGTADVPTVLLISDYSKNSVTRVFLSLNTAPHTHTHTPAWFLLQITRCSMHRKTPQSPPEQTAPVIPYQDIKENTRIF